MARHPLLLPSRSARNAAETVLARENVKTHHADKYWVQRRSGGNLSPQRHYFSRAMVDKTEREAFVAQEAQRCLECNYVCSKCVDVCPNRANVSIAIPGFQDRFQTLHLDAYCNECGNCAQFCPWQGKPYKDKVTIYSLPQDFANSTNPGFLVDGAQVSVRQGGKLYQLQIDRDGQLEHVPSELEEMCRIISHVHTHHHYLLGQVEV
ncbi:putative selenate reductase subunit YgfK [Serratia fonticola]|uniref:Putative selenate reductase subunit YgfK n=1 Tax=Serratia fonticola TaxID=47917 RepID=A0A4U9UCK2_SERFO|nr:putative selenate reductase subunit YgfK [Serratia fonticola]